MGWLFGSKKKPAESPAAAEKTVFDFDMAIRTSGGDPLNLTPFWNAFFGLEQWHFVARNIDLSTAGGTAYVGSHPEGPLVYAFTDADRAHKFAVDAKLANLDGTIPILSMPLVNAIEYCQRLESQGVVGVTVNQNLQGTPSPMLVMANLGPMLQFFREDLCYTDIPETERAALVTLRRCRSDPNGQWVKLARRVFSVPAWYRFSWKGEDQPLAVNLDGANTVCATADEKSTAKLLAAMGQTLGSADCKVDPPALEPTERWVNIGLSWYYGVRYIRFFADGWHAVVPVDQLPHIHDEVMRQ